MRNITSLLVAVDGSSSSDLVIDKAVLLAAASGARVHVVQVVHEPIAEVKLRDVDQSVDLKTPIMDTAYAALENLVKPYRPSFADLSWNCVWNHRTWEGILEAAESCEADMILQVASIHSRLAEIIHTPDDWNVLRPADIPVMLVKPQPWVDNPVILAALDVFDDAHRPLNLEILRAAIELTKILGGELHTVTAYPLRPASSARTVGQTSDASPSVAYDVFKAAFASDIRHELDSLRHELGVELPSIHADEGGVGHAIRAVAVETQAEMIVLGTHGRLGIKGVLLGNTAERILHSVNTDVVTIRG